MKKKDFEKNIEENIEKNFKENKKFKVLSEEEIASNNDFEDYIYELKVPKERIPVIIGTKGTTKKHLEEEMNVKLKVDSHEGDITIIGKDPIKLYTAKEVIRAIGRGFSPENALDLLKQDYNLEIVDIRDYAHTKNALIQKRGRVIGEKGRSRKTIEKLTDTKISVYGKTVGIIGRLEDTMTARRAVESLLGQAQHSTVYRMLERKRAEQKRREALWLNEDEEVLKEYKELMNKKTEE